MKKNSIFFAALFLCSTAGMNAEDLNLDHWRPSCTATAVGDVVGSESSYYLYNVGAGAFLEGGSDWGTRAAITNGKDVTALTALYSGSCDNKGYKWLISQAEDTTCIIFANKSTSGWMTADNENGIWVDGPNNNADRPHDKWVLTKQENNTFYLSTTHLNGYFGVDLGVDARTYFRAADAAENIDFQYTWAFVSAEEQANVQPNLKLWWKARGVYNSLTKAINDNPSVDFSSVIAKFNTETTAAALDELQAMVDKIIKDKALSDIESASLDNKVNVTGLFGDAVVPTNDTDLGKYWKRVYTTDRQNGTWHINSWSTEGNTDGTDMTTNFFENWINKNDKSHLMDQKMYATLEAPKAGAYMYTINARPYDQNNASEADGLQGVVMFGNMNSNDIAEQDPSTALFTGMRWYWKDGGFTGYTLVGTDKNEKHPLTLGFRLEDANIDWLAFKDIKIYYLGASQDAVDQVKANSAFDAVELDDDVLAMYDLKEAFNEAVGDYEDASSVEGLLAAYQTILDLNDSVASSVAAYEKYVVACAKAKAELNKMAVDESNPYYMRLFTYLRLEMNPGASTGVDDEYPVFKNGTYETIIYELTLDNKALEEEIEFVEAITQIAIIKSLNEGQECTNMLINPDFSAAGAKNKWTGWTINHSTVNQSEDNNPRGGEYKVDGVSHYSAELYGGWGATGGFLFDIYQEVAGVPDGLYEITFNGFYRYGDPADVWANREKPIQACLYMGDFETPMPSILNDGFMGVENEETGVMDKNPSTVGAWSPINMGDDKTMFIPNDMTAATYSFYTPKANGEGHYLASTYGLVQGGKMRIGVKKTAKTTDLKHWVLFSNFRLFYMGKNEAASKSVIEKFSADAEAILNNTETPLISDWYLALDGAVSAAKAAAGNASIDKEELYNSVLALNAALKVARQQLDTIVNFNYKLTDLLQAVEECEDDAISEEVGMWANTYSAGLTNGELTAQMLAEFFAAFDEKYATVKTVLKADAGAENPQDLAESLLNPVFETDTQWNGDAWAINNGNAEQYNKNFDVYQKVYLPAGHYQIVTQAFYRRGTWANEDTCTVLDKYKTLLYAIAAGETDTTCCVAVKNGADMLCADSLGGDGCTQFIDSLTTTESFKGKWYPNKQASAEIWFDAADEEGNPFFGINWLNFEVKKAGEYRLGFVKRQTCTNDWFVCNGFELYYTGSEDGLAHESTAIEMLGAAPAVKHITSKRIENGQLFIISNGRKYTVLGTVIK